MEKKLVEILKIVDDLVEKDFVTPRFGMGWKAHAEKHYDKQMVIDIAWKNGRKVELLTRFLGEMLLNQNDDFDILSIKSKLRLN